MVTTEGSEVDGYRNGDREMHHVEVSRHVAGDPARKGPRRCHRERPSGQAVSRAVRAHIVEGNPAVREMAVDREHVTVGEHDHLLGAVAARELLEQAPDVCLRAAHSTWEQGEEADADPHRTQPNQG